MSLFYITGISGSGKSTVGNELSRRGHEVYEVDDGLAASYERTTGKIAVRPDKPEHRNPEWRARHIWKVPRGKVEELAEKAKGRPVFLCGTVENDIEIWDLFSEAVALVVDEQTLRRRITTRKNNNFGQNPHELDTILVWQKRAADDYKKMGATLVDATQPLDKVVDEILSLTSSK